MQLSSACMRCIIDIEEDRIKDVNDEALKREYMRRIAERIGNLKESDTAPYLVNRFDRLYEEMFLDTIEFHYIKQDFNQMVLDREAEIKKLIQNDNQPLLKALILARVGNYIDFGALKEVNTDQFLDMLMNAKPSDMDRDTFINFRRDLESHGNLLILADNCGEIVLDRFFAEQLLEEYPHMNVTLMVKGGDVMNDATREDAVHAGFGKRVKIVDTGISIAGTDPTHISDAALAEVERAQIILSKGQANFETFCGAGYRAYYSFLCKCNHFARLFDVKPLTGIFADEDYCRSRI